MIFDDHNIFSYYVTGGLVPMHWPSFFVFISNIKVNPKHIFFRIVKRRKWRKITLYLL